ncbi:hypothetical protein GMLC_15780 [Geomonas limicola]|uniref:Uncharacterized protein n=1 Tax=Geomonas limicola TaxID=2740186 RepID=A0A6V8N9R9_9BACT|nr:hypothetical protein GMLC_15780 [Geomonas limicola]
MAITGTCFLHYHSPTFKCATHSIAHHTHDTPTGEQSFLKILPLSVSSVTHVHGPGTGPVAAALFSSTMRG